MAARGSYFIAVAVLSALLVVSICINLFVFTKFRKPPCDDSQTESCKAEIITYSQLGKHGRLGNQLFQIASVVGAAKGDFSRVRLPHWNYVDKFANTDPLVFNTNLNGKPASLEHDAFQYMPITSAPMKVLDVSGYRQNVKYFSKVVHLIRELFEIPAKTKFQIIHALPVLKREDCIGVHVRRGDYTQSSNFRVYQVCTEAYYQDSVKYLRGLGGGPVVVISDDIPWCKKAFKDIPDVFYSPFKDDTPDMFALSLCRYTVLSNSTFSFWGAFLAGPATTTVAPWPWIKDGQKFDEVYLPEWRVIEAATGRVIRDRATTGPEIGAYYQCYRQPKALIRALASFRHSYPSSSLHIVRDGGGGEYCKAIAMHFNATNFTSTSTQTGNGITSSLTSTTKAIEFVRNLIQAAKEMKEEYFVLLEDDVCILNRIGRLRGLPSWWGSFDLVGCNRVGAKFNAATLDLFPGDVRPNSSYYGGCGGSLFRTQFWAQSVHIDTLQCDALLKAFGHANHGNYWADVVLSFLCIYYGGQISDGPPVELIESETEISSVSCILHQYKKHYNNELNSNDKYIIGLVCE